MTEQHYRRLTAKNLYGPTAASLTEKQIITLATVGGAMRVVLGMETTVLKALLPIYNS